MSTKISALKYQIQYQGLFDFDGLFELVISWAKNYGWLWQEVDYNHKIPNPFGGEQELEWKIEKNVTEYVKYEIRFTVHVWENLEVEVESDGKKKMLSNARIHIWISPTVIIDWQNEFTHGKFGKLLGKWYYNAVKKKEVESVWWDQLRYRTINLHALLKKFFDMQSKQNAYKQYLGEN